MPNFGHFKTWKTLLLPSLQNYNSLKCFVSPNCTSFNLNVRVLSLEIAFEEENSLHLFSSHFSPTSLTIFITFCSHFYDSFQIVQVLALIYFEKNCCQLKYLCVAQPLFCYLPPLALIYEIFYFREVEIQTHFMSNFYT